MTKQNKFSVGDRVRVYGTLLGEIELSGTLGVVIENNSSYGPPAGFITVVYYKNGSKFTKHVHPKQCRKLVKKPRRRIWVNIHPNGYDDVWSSKELADRAAGMSSRTDCREFIEVRKGKKG